MNMKQFIIFSILLFCDGAHHKELKEFGINYYEELALNANLKLSKADIKPLQQFLYNARECHDGELNRFPKEYSRSYYIIPKYVDKSFIEIYKNADNSDVYEIIDHLCGGSRKLNFPLLKHLRQEGKRLYITPTVNTRTPVINNMEESAKNICNLKIVNRTHDLSDISVMKLAKKVEIVKRFELETKAKTVLFLNPVTGGGGSATYTPIYRSLFQAEEKNDKTFAPSYRIHPDLIVLKTSLETNTYMATSMTKWGILEIIKYIKYSSPNEIYVREDNSLDEKDGFDAFFIATDNTYDTKNYLDEKNNIMPKYEHYAGALYPSHGNIIIKQDHEGYFARLGVITPPGYHCYPLDALKSYSRLDRGELLYHSFQKMAVKNIIMYKFKLSTLYFCSYSKRFNNDVALFSADITPIKIRSSSQRAIRHDYILNDKVTLKTKIDLSDYVNHNIRHAAANCLFNAFNGKECTNYNTQNILSAFFLKMEQFYKYNNRQSDFLQLVASDTAYGAKYILAFFEILGVCQDEGSKTLKTLLQTFVSVLSNAYKLDEVAALSIQSILNTISNDAMIVVFKEWVTDVQKINFAELMKKQNCIDLTTLEKMFVNPSKLMGTYLNFDTETPPFKVKNPQYLVKPPTPYRYTEMTKSLIYGSASVWVVGSVLGEYVCNAIIESNCNKSVQNLAQMVRMDQFKFTAKQCVVPGTTKWVLPPPLPPVDPKIAKSASEFMSEY